MTKRNDSAPVYSGSRRRKIWEVRGYHCSIIGTCFTRTEIRKLASRRKLGIFPGLTDYQIHSALVNLCTSRSEEAKSIHRVLDRKYRGFITRFSRVKTERGVKDLWSQSLKRGAIAGAYWAVMTHSATGTDLAADIHGEIHMIGHDFTDRFQRDVLNVSDLQIKVDILEEVLVSERRDHQKEHKKLQEQIANLLSVQLENDELRLAAIQGGNSEADPLRQIQVKELEESVTSLRRDNAGLCGEIDKLTADLEDIHELFELAGSTVKDLEETNVRLVQERDELQQEILSLESALALNMGNSSAACPTCEGCEVENCLGPDLCGKTVLYVGGHHKMIPRYRQLVEKFGGMFLHHDGGRETSRNILPKVVTRADAVLCPVDCVSHDACKCVKKMCKRYQKDYVMMRSSGLSSLVRGLNEITQ